MREMREWLPVFLSFYPALHARVPTIVYGSQIIAVTQGVDVSSKDIDLLCPNVTLMAIEEAYLESSGEDRMRLELLRSGEGYFFTLYYPLGERPMPIEIFTRTYLGSLSVLRSSGGGEQMGEELPLTLLRSLCGY